MRSTGVSLRILLTALVCAAAAPSAAHAASATVTGDAGQEVPLTGTGPTIGNIAPAVTFTFAPDEEHYSFTIKGPTGEVAGAPLACNTPGYARPEDVYYQGNGVYTVILQVSKNADDGTCAQAVEQRFTFTISARPTVLPPPGVLMTARTPTSALNPYAFTVQPIPGNDHYDLQYAIDAKLNADGSIAGEHSADVPDKHSGKTTITFGLPGRYTFVARSESDRGITAGFTPWSAPVFVTVVAPFGVDTVLSNAHIGTVKITGSATEPTATGTVTASLAKGKSGTFRKLATLKLGSSARFTLKFKVKTAGTYRVKYVYKGNSTVVAGTAVEVVRLKR